MSNVLKMLSRGGAATAETDPNFNQTVLLLHGDGTNGAQNNTFLDSSTNNFTITRNGNTTQGTFSPFSLAAGEWSNYFDGSGDFLSLTATSALQLQNNTAFAIEFWVYIPTIPSVGNAQFVIRAYNMSSPFQGYGIGFGANDLNTNLQFWNGTTWSNIGAVSAATWTHIAVTYEGSGSTLRYFINGTQQGSATTVPSTINWTGTEFIVGARNNDKYLNAYLSNVRVVKGSAVYTSNFTPSTTPLTAITNTSLLTCQSNRFVDNSTNAFAITRNGDVRVTPFSPFAPTAAYSAGTNGGSGYFDGTGDYLTVARNTAFIPTTGDFTFEAWVYPLANNAIIAGLQETGTAADWNFFIASDSTIGLFVGSGGGQRNSTQTVRLGSWNHIVACRSGSTLYIGCNGALTSSTFTNSLNNNQSYPLSIGADQNGDENNLTGWISGLRLINGSAEYASTTYTVPTAPPTAITNTSLLLNFTNAGIFDNTGKNVLETVGNAQIDTAVKKFGTGSLEFDGTDDRIFTPSSVDLIMGTGNFTIEGWFYANSTSNKGIFQLSSAAGGLDPSAATANIAFALQTNGYTVYAANTGTTITSVVPSTTTWTHFAVVRSSGVTRLYINGSQAGSNITDTTNYAGGNLVVGGYYSTSFLFNGYIDDLRVTKGVARYTANFTPPTKEFPDQ